MSDLSSKAIAYWPLDETAYTQYWVDVVSGANTLEDGGWAGGYPGGVGNVAGVCGGTGAFFNPGAGDSLTRASTTELESEWVMWTGWGYCTPFNTGSGTPWFCKCNIFPASPDYELFQLNDTGNTLEWRVRKADNSATITVNAGAVSSGWHFFCCYDTGTEIGLSLDNGAFVTQSYVGGRRVTSSTFATARNPGVGSYHWNSGGLSQFGCWGVMLTAADLTYLYGDVGPVFYPFLEKPSLIDDCAAYYAMEEASGATRVDSVGGLNLTDNGTVTQVTGENAFASGYNATSIFVGTQYLSRASNAAFSIDKAGADGFSISVWFYPQTAAFGGPIAAKGYSNGGNHLEWQLQQGTGGGGGQCNFYVARSAGGTDVVVANTEMTIGAWNHIYASYRSSDGQLECKVNCGARGTGSLLGNNPRVDTGDFLVGSYFNNVRAYARGRIDELAIYQRLLTDQEISARAGCICPPEWPFDEAPAGGIAFEGYISRQFSPQPYADAAYGTKRYFLITSPTAGTTRIVQQPVDMNGAQAGEKVNVKVQRDGDDPNDDSTANCTLTNVRMDYYTTQ